MKPIIAFPFRHHGTLVCPEAKQMLIDAGFELRTNDTGIALSREEQKDMIRGAFAVVAGTEKYDADMLEAADELRVIIRFGVGLDNFDLKTMKEKGIKVGVIANYNAVAEYTLTLILSMLRHVPEYDTAARQGLWSRYESHELSGKTVGIVGFGRIGMRLAELLSGFGVKLLAFDPYMNDQKAAALHVTPVTLETLFKESDVVSLHVPGTPETKHLINRESLAMMKDGAYLVNTARGMLVDEAALKEALDSGKLGGAALDVYEKEPVTADNPLFGLRRNTVLSPHIAALTFETNYQAGITASESIIRVFSGGEAVYPVR